MPTNPILDFAVLLDSVLDFLEREQPALQGRKLALEHLQTVDARAALPVQGLPRRFELGEQRFLAGKLGSALRQLLRQARQQLRIGCNQLGPLGEQSFLALLHLALPPGVALRAQLRKLRVETLPGIGYEAYFGFKAGDVGVDAVELPLRRAQCVPRSVVLCPRPLEIA